jgi:hypothetical protein
MKTNGIRCAAKGIALMVVWLGAVPGIALGWNVTGDEKTVSTPGQPADGSDTAAKRGPAATTAQILEELERMRARIAELEAQLKAQAANEPEAAMGANRALTANQPQPAVANDASGREAAGTPVEAIRERTVASAANDAKKPKAEPFAFADFTWLNGNSREKDLPFDTKFFTPEFRADTSYIDDLHHPVDHTLVGSSESGRTSEIQVQQLGIGGDFHWENVRGRLMTQFGMYSTMTPRNDPSPGVGQWDLWDAYRYLSEAYGGYHFNALHGINVDAGIFLSYIGLFSYYNYDNWAYQPSYVSSNTPWFFNGVRAQFFLTEKLKIEPWFINGWQSYGSANNRHGLGMQFLWRPNGKLSIIGNQYALGRDAVGAPGRSRFHTDDSVQYKFYDNPERFLDKAAFSLTLDAGCESGSGVTCFGNNRGPTKKQYFLGGMLYSRFWFDHDLFGLTLGGGGIDNPGRYLVLVPPINGATAFSGTPYFTENPGDQYKAYDWSATFDYMPKQYITFRTEFDRRGANVPYFAGPGGVTPPGGNTCVPGGSAPLICPPGSLVPGFTPDLRHTETRINLAILVKF